MPRRLVVSGTTADEVHRRAIEETSHVAPSEPRALGVMALVAAAAILSILMPVGLGVLVGALLAFTLHRTYVRLAKRTGRPALVALGLTLGASLAVTGTLGVLAYLVVLQGISVVGDLPRVLAARGPIERAVEELARPLTPLGIHTDAVLVRLRDALGNIATILAGWAAQMLMTVVDGLLAILFMVATMYFVLRRWSSLARRAETLLPINPHHTRRLMRELERLGRAVVVGNFGTAIVQGTVAGTGYVLARVPHSAFFGAVTAVASLVPVFGTLIVWLPIAAVLLAEGHVGGGGLLVVWGSVAVVGFCDYVVRPKLVGRGETMPPWTMLVALFGGIKLFGFVGCLLGPLFVGIALSVLRVYERTRRFRLGLG